MIYRGRQATSKIFVISILIIILFYNFNPWLYLLLMLCVCSPQAAVKIFIYAQTKNFKIKFRSYLHTEKFLSLFVLQKIKIYLKLY